MTDWWAGRWRMTNDGPAKFTDVPITDEPPFENFLIRYCVDLKVQIIFRGLPSFFFREKSGKSQGILI